LKSKTKSKKKAFKWSKELSPSTFQEEEEEEEEEAEDSEKGGEEEQLEVS